MAFLNEEEKEKELKSIRDRVSKISPPKLVTLDGVNGNLNEVKSDIDQLRNSIMSVNSTAFEANKEIVTVKDDVSKVIQEVSAVMSNADQAKQLALDNKLLLNKANESLKDFVELFENFKTKNAQEIAEAKEAFSTKLAEETGHNKALIMLLVDGLEKLGGVNDISADNYCPLMNSLNDVAALEHKVHLTGCQQPANSYPVYEELGNRQGIVAYLSNIVSCSGAGSHSQDGYTDTFGFELVSGECWVSEWI
jgi:hypothetical protein